MQICKLEDIPAGSACEYVINNTHIFIVHSKTHEITAYLNRCPHLGVPLNWNENQFMDSDSSFIRCSTHGAMFEPESGLCILGPCRGESLWQLTCSIENGNIYIDEAELPDSNPSEV